MSSKIEIPKNARNTNHLTKQTSARTPDTTLEYNKEDNHINQQCVPDEDEYFEVSCCKLNNDLGTMFSLYLLRLNLRVEGCENRRQ